MLERLTGQVQPYAWGSRTVLPDFLQVEPTGEPQAELWLGSHAVAPSRILGRPLGDLVSAEPHQVLGAGTVARFGPRLPYLMKVLAPAQPLSLQVHPSREQAIAGFAREEALRVPRDAPHRMYRDDWPKPELYCALERTDALCGFRSPAETYHLFERLGVPSVLLLVEPLREGAVEGLKGVFERLLRLGDQAPALIRDVVRAAAAVDPAALAEPAAPAAPAGADCSAELARLALTARELAALYPQDPGVLAALLMNRVTLAPGEALFLPAGNAHAYLHGHGVEIMANSDNVVRVGLTPKYVNVDELLSLLDFAPGLQSLITPVEESPGVWAYRTPAAEFSLWRLEVADGRTVRLPARESGRIVLVSSGAATFSAAGGCLDLRRGQSAFVSADESEVQVSGSGTVFVGGPGR